MLLAGNLGCVSALTLRPPRKASLPPLSQADLVFIQVRVVHQLFPRSPSWSRCCRWTCGGMPGVTGSTPVRAPKWPPSTSPPLH